MWQFFQGNLDMWMNRYTRQTHAFPDSFLSGLIKILFVNAQVPSIGCFPSKISSSRLMLQD